MSCLLSDSRPCQQGGKQSEKVAAHLLQGNRAMEELWHITALPFFSQSRESTVDSTLSAMPQCWYGSSAGALWVNPQISTTTLHFHLFIF